jgi:peptidyl-prolyl cis-trans isomerase C
MLAILISLLTACGGQPAPTADVPADSATLPPTQAAVPTNVLPVNGSGVQLVARVNGTDITLPDFQRALERRQQLMLDAADPAALQSEVLDQMIEQVLIEQAATQQRLTVSDEELQAQLQEHKNLAGSEAAWQDWLAANLYTPEEFAQTLRETLIANLVRDSVIQGLQGNVLQVHARHILVATEAEANSLLVQFQAGADFAGLAAAHSLDTSTREAGGDLGWFSQDGLMTPELAATAFALQPGQIAGPIVTTLGYHIIQTLEIAERPIEPAMLGFVSQMRFENWMQAQRAGAVIEKYWG